MDPAKACADPVLQLQALLEWAFPTDIFDWTVEEWLPEAADTASPPPPAAAASHHAPPPKRHHRPPPPKRSATQSGLAMDARGVLHVHLKRGQGLMAADLGFMQSGKSDPYVRITANGKERKSKVIKVSVIDHQPSAIGHQSSAIRHQPSAISHQSSAISHQPSAISHQPSVINHQPSAISHSPQHKPYIIISHRVSGIGHQLTSRREQGGVAT